MPRPKFVWAAIGLAMLGALILALAPISAAETLAVGASVIGCIWFGFYGLIGTPTRMMKGAALSLTAAVAAIVGVMTSALVRAGLGV